MAFEVHPASAVLGAEIRGVDLSREIDGETFARIEAAFDQYSLLFFRNQTLTEDQHLRFARRFGELEIHPRKESNLPSYPELMVLTNIVEGGIKGNRDGGFYWHSDVSYTKKPARCSLLYAREIPVAGKQALGDTLFASTVAAYDALPQEMKQRIVGLKAVHSYGDQYERFERELAQGDLTEEQLAAIQEKKAQFARVVHPVVRTHPRTGRKCLYVNPGFTIGIEGMDDAECRQLIEELVAHCVQPQFQYGHKWAVGDLLLWDNCSTLHKATADYQLPHRRLMHRATVSGSVPF